MFNINLRIFSLMVPMWNLHKFQSWCMLIANRDLCKHCIWGRTKKWKIAGLDSICADIIINNMHLTLEEKLSTWVGDTEHEKFAFESHQADAFASHLPPILLKFRYQLNGTGSPTRSSKHAQTLLQASSRPSTNMTKSDQRLKKAPRKKKKVRMNLGYVNLRLIPTESQNLHSNYTIPKTFHLCFSCDCPSSRKLLGRAEILIKKFLKFMVFAIEVSTMSKHSVSPFRTQIGRRESANRINSRSGEERKSTTKLLIANVQDGEKDQSKLDR